MVRPNIHEEVKAVCERLWLEPNLVRQMTIRPDRVDVEYYKLNADGEKYVDPETNEAAIDTLYMPVTA